MNRKPDIAFAQAQMQRGLTWKRQRQKYVFHRALEEARRRELRTAWAPPALVAFACTFSDGTNVTGERINIPFVGEKLLWRNILKVTHDGYDFESARADKERFVFENPHAEVGGQNCEYRVAAIGGAAAAVLGAARPLPGVGRRVADGRLHLPRPARAHIGQLQVSSAMVSGRRSRSQRRVGSAERAGHARAAGRARGLRASPARGGALRAAQQPLNHDQPAAVLHRMRSAAGLQGQAHLPLLAHVLQRGRVLRQLHPRPRAEGGLDALRERHAALAGQAPRHVRHQDRARVDQTRHLRRHRHLRTPRPGARAGLGALQPHRRLHGANGHLLPAVGEGVRRAVADGGGGAAAGEVGGHGSVVRARGRPGRHRSARRSPSPAARVDGPAEAGAAAAVRVRVGARAAPAARVLGAAGRGAAVAGAVPARDGLRGRRRGGRVRGVSRRDALRARHSVRALLPRGLPAPLPRRLRPLPDMRAALRVLLTRCVSDLVYRKY